MNIQDFRQKYKALIADDAVFLALLIILVGVGSFGLGRLSMVPLETPAQAAAVVMTRAAPEEAVSTARAESEGPSVLNGTETSVQGQYVGSKNSDKYHLPSCSGARRIAEENKVWFASREAAAAAGYVPASNCPGLE